MTTLYQKDSLGRIRIWSINVEHFYALEYSKIIIDSGLLDGKKTTTVTEIADGTNIGRSNERKYWEQAEFDAKTEINKKKKSGYVENISEIKNKTDSATIQKPAKGLVYHPTGKLQGSLTLKSASLSGKPIGIQRKLDGWRYRIWTDGEDVIYYTSSGDIAQGFPQITKVILERFELFREEFGVIDVILDGEIYNHKLGYQAVASACGTKVKFTPEKQKLRDQMQFHIFDIVGNYGNYKRRYNLTQIFADSESILPVPTLFLKHASDNDIKDIFEEYLEEGYEGLIIRNLEKEYEHKKSKQFLKYKPLIDEEFDVIGFEKSIAGELVGSIVLQMSDGKIFSANPKGEIGTDVFKKKMWDNKNHFLGMKATVEFLEYTDDGIPRLPRAIKFRDKTDM